MSIPSLHFIQLLFLFVFHVFNAQYCIIINNRSLGITIISEENLQLFLYYNDLGYSKLKIDRVSPSIKIDLNGKILFKVKPNSLIQKQHTIDQRDLELLTSELRKMIKLLGLEPVSHKYYNSQFHTTDWQFALVHQEKQIVRTKLEEYDALFMKNSEWISECVRAPSEILCFHKDQFCLGFIRYLC